jgi:protein-disulfide isomerase
MSQTNPDTSTAPAGEAAAIQPATPTIMEFVMSDARHMQGDVDAPVTIIEFSDFK